MSTRQEQIIEKQKEIIQTLRRFLAVGGEESDHYGYYDKVHRIESEIAALESPNEPEQRLAEAEGKGKEDQLSKELTIDQLMTYFNNHSKYYINDGSLKMPVMTRSDVLDMVKWIQVKFTQNNRSHSDQPPAKEKIL